MIRYRYSVARPLAEWLADKLGSTTNSVYSNAWIFSIPGIKVSDVKIYQLGLVAIVDAREKPEVAGLIVGGDLDVDRPILAVTGGNTFLFDEIDDGVIIAYGEDKEKAKEYAGVHEYVVVDRNVLGIDGKSKFTEYVGGKENEFTVSYYTFPLTIPLTTQTKLPLLSAERTEMPKMNFHRWLVSLVYNKGEKLPAGGIILAYFKEEEAIRVLEDAFVGGRLIRLATSSEFPLAPTVLLSPHYVQVHDPLFFVDFVADTIGGVVLGNPPLNLFTYDFSKKFITSLPILSEDFFHPGYLISVFTEKSTKIISISPHDGVEYYVVEATIGEFGRGWSLVSSPI